MKTLDIKINELSSPEYESILNRAKDRIEEAILFQSVSEQSRNDDIEILSFPIAVMMVAATANIYLKRSYALAEAKRVSNLLKHESKENIIDIANNFNWNIKSIQDRVDSLPYDIALHFTDFLKNTESIKTNIALPFTDKGKYTTYKFLSGIKCTSDEINKCDWINNKKSIEKY